MTRFTNHWTGLGRTISGMLLATGVASTAMADGPPAVQIDLDEPLLEGGADVVPALEVLVAVGGSEGTIDFRKYRDGAVTREHALLIPRTRAGLDGGLRPIENDQGEAVAESLFGAELATATLVDDQGSRTVLVLLTRHEIRPVGAKKTELLIQAAVVLQEVPDMSSAAELVSKVGAWLEGVSVPFTLEEIGAEDPQIGTGDSRLQADGADAILEDPCHAMCAEAFDAMVQHCDAGFRVAMTELFRAPYGSIQAGAGPQPLRRLAEELVAAAVQGAESAAPGLLDAIGLSLDCHGDAVEWECNCLSNSCFDPC